MDANNPDQADLVSLLSCFGKVEKIMAYRQCPPLAAASNRKRVLVAFMPINVDRNSSRYPRTAVVGYHKYMSTTWMGKSHTQRLY